MLNIFNLLTIKTLVLHFEFKFNILMKIVVSPAKSLDFDKNLNTNFCTKPVFLKQSKQIMSVLKKLKPIDLQHLMNISPALAELNWQRNKQFKTPFSAQNARPAIFTFNGEVYLGLNAFGLAIEKHEILQEKVRILSGLYGILKPFDLMQAYRLEMGTQLKINEHENLYLFWRETITNALNKELKKGDFLVNLASNEYFSVIDSKKIKVPIVTPEFKDFKMVN